MKSAYKSLAIVAALVMLCGAANANAATYTVAKGSKVSFVGKITAGSFTAKSAELSGTVDYDETSGVITSAIVKLRADSLKTGMSSRDNHMREKYIEAEKFPDIVFTVESATIPATADSGSVKGAFTIKGKTKKLDIPVTVSERTAGGITLKSAFKLDIKDYGIPQPKFAVVKMQTVIDVTLDLVLTK